MSRKLSDSPTPEDLEWLRNNNRSEEARRLEADQTPPPLLTPIPPEFQEEFGEDDYDEWKVSELKKEVLARGIELGDGKVLKADLIKFLRDDDIAEASA